MNPEDVKLLILDVDGVLTDGHLYLSEDGTETKCFHVHDGQGLVLLYDVSVQIAVISARKSDATRQRLQELEIGEVILGCDDKYAEACAVIERVGCTWEEVVCVGDDVTDIPLLEAAGMGVAVADARPQVREAADWVTPSPGGRGAVRDVCDWILRR